MIPGEPPQTQTGGEFSSAAEQAGHRQVGGVASRIALMVICAMSGSIEYHPTAEDSAMVSVETSVAGSGAVGEGRSEATGALPEDPDQALTTALDDLNTALEGIPGRSPEEILHGLSVPGQGCMIAWTNHLPSLLYGKEPIGPNSLAYTVEGCAKAVSRLH